MRRRVVTPFAPLEWLLILLLAAAAQAQQDTWKGVERIVAVGDVHGDFGQFVKALRAAGVVDDRNDWAAGKTHLVQLGDVLDRGPDSRRAMDLLMKLEAQAAKAGGAVHALLGNHEAMVLAGAWFYLHPGEIQAFGTAADFRQAMSAEGAYGQWLRRHNAVIQINDTLFAHAGLLPLWAKPSLRQINDAVRRELGQEEEGGLTLSYTGPLWTRFLALGDEEEVAAALDEVFAKYGAKRMVIGHTVAREGVLVRAGGRLVRVDVGMSEYYGGPAACLVIEKGDLYEARHPDLKRKLDVDRAAPAEAKKAG
ncbi:MAG TPA: metallophosphoesterase [Planctomycetota bacterium]|nr:metallophosphoesterase [Planctomycetota bacterium]HRR81169.1 metallophosphoesterase [Planctomycetota bacterium]HRT95563.1 metallophosphoesterase [Planctomycetota bacterium]